MGRPRRLGRLGLRARVTAAFALGALMVSLALATMTYAVTRSYLLRQRESAALRETFLSARVVKAGLKAASPDVPRLLGSVETESGSKSLIRYRGEWFSSSLVVGRDSVPGGLRQAVAAGHASRQLSRVGGLGPQMAVGVPLPAVDALYFELVPLGELDRTLRILSASLALAAVVTTLAGALVGRWAASRLLRPLRVVTDAAAEVARGHLDIRLDAADDRDLAVIADSFNGMVDALQRRIESDERFASDVSHELRSPLTTISTAVDVMLTRRDDMPERARQALDLMAADVRRFERLVQNLLEISRAEGGAANVVLESVRLAELVLQAIGPMAVEVEVSPAASAAVVMADKRRLEQVVINFVANATLHGGGLTRVGVSCHDQTVRVEFDDNGPGVDPADRERIFERFARGSGSDRRTDGDGVGLGLALVREHLRLHGGRAWADSSPSGGARFVFEMPAVNA